MTKSEQKKKKNFFLLKLIRFFMFTLLFFIILLIITIFMSPFLIEKFLDRKIEFEKINFSLSSAKLSLNKLKMTTSEDEKLFTADEIIIDLSIKKLMGLKLAFDSLYIDNAYTYIIKTGTGSIKPADYLNLNFTNNTTTFSLPFELNKLQIKNSTIEILENQLFKPFISDINIQLPGIKSLEDTSNLLTPSISGIYNNRKFILKGKTILMENGVKNLFSFNMKNYNIAKEKFFLPVMNNLTITNGIFNAELILTFDILKNKKSSFYIGGHIDFYGLSFIQNDNNYKNLAGRLSMNKINFADKKFDLENLRLNYGLISLNNLTFNKKSDQKIILKNFDFSNINLIIKKIPPLTSDISLSKLSGNLQNYSSSSLEFNYNLNFIFADISSCIISGKRNNNSYKFDKLQIKNLKYTDLPINNKVESINNFTIDTLNGSAIIEKKNLIFDGDIILTDILLGNKKNSIKINYLKTYISDFNAMNQKLNLNDLSITNLSYYKNNSLKLSNLSLNVFESENKYRINYADNIFFNDVISLKNISFNLINYLDKNAGNKTSVSQVDMAIKLSFNEDDFILGGLIDAHNILSINNNKQLINIEKIKLNINNLKLNPVQYNISEIMIENGQTNINMDKNNDIIFAQWLKLNNTNNFNRKNANNIDTINLKDININFVDNTFEKSVNTNFNSINLHITNYPSTVYPTGNYKCSGILNKSDFLIHGQISNNNIEGIMKVNDLFLLPFSPYSEKYIKHKLLSGSVNAEIPFNFGNNGNTLDFDLKFNNLILDRIDTTYPVQLNNIIKVMQDKNKIFSPKIPPITFKDDQTHINIPKLFFDNFIEVLSHSTKKFTSDIKKIEKDEKYYIVIFKPGTDTIINFYLDDDKVSEIIKNKKYLIIETFVDKKIETQILKEQKLNNMKEKYTTDLNEIEILENIYSQVSNEQLTNYDKDTLTNKILQNIHIENAEYTSLTNNRKLSIKNYLLNNFTIKEDAILFSDNEIFENPYSTGLSNNIGIIHSAIQK